MKSSILINLSFSYWNNGGKTLGAVLEAANVGVRFIVSLYLSGAQENLT